ncbi:MAG: hypothetical protein EA385_15040 [Salinarimonadaceae bacterium]|nr:MAG: hypothetical protein EA385_15040 [Salinarimonadaceae bacterium]
MTTAADLFRALFARVSDMERRIAGAQWKGRVSQVDAAKGITRLIIGKDADGADVLSPWVPYAQTAGALKLHSSPSVGQQMEIVSAAGDIRQGTARPLHWWSENASPSDREDEHVVTFEGWTISLTPEALIASKGETRLRLEEGKAEVESLEVLVKSPKVDLGDENGPEVARIGDLVLVEYGSSAGLHPIVTGSSMVRAAG